MLISPDRGARAPRMTAGCIAGHLAADTRDTRPTFPAINDLKNLPRTKRPLPSHHPPIPITAPHPIPQHSPRPRPRQVRFFLTSPHPRIVPSLHPYPYLPGPRRGAARAPHDRGLHRYRGAAVVRDARNHGKATPPARRCLPVSTSRMLYHYARSPWAIAPIPCPALPRPDPRSQPRAAVKSRQVP
ncbi:hypothetical protein B0H15DRAFT_954460 [Mycena belliarum]|uniref:Uncharacterized protein n=1 Tax=Mycena belliarum TaxID=1033014 RepID=A0AAD6TYE5_9AGAR|nr:hypothetical protein B0H15DRAFT_954460 [Mycena belliae]